MQEVYYSSLEHDLTTNRLSSYVTINVNWTKLLNQTGLSDEKINEFKQKMLHIYNIIANLYGKDNILKLLQEVIMEEQTGRTIATVWPKRIKVNNTEVNMQNMYVGPKFVNQEMINDNYSAGWFASNSITSIITHEYGHAISFFMTSDSNDRSMFNCFKFDPYFSSDILPSMSQSLVEYLNKTANIADNQIKREFFPLIVVRSDYGRSY